MIEYDYRIRNTTVTESDFRYLHALVAEVAKRRRLAPAFGVERAVISDSLDELSIPIYEQDSARRTADRSVGFAYPHSGNIWIKGDRDKAEQLTTILHELAHVYQRSDAHGAAWRKFYCQVLTSWLHHKGLTTEDIRWQVAHVVAVYRKSRRSGADPDSRFAARTKEIGNIFRSCPAMWTATAEI